MNKRTTLLASHSGPYAWLLLLMLAGVMLSGCAAPQATLETIGVTIEVDGMRLAIQAPAGTDVQAALRQANVQLNTLDRVDPPSYTLLTDGDTIQVTRVREEFTVQENIIPFERKTLNNETLPEEQTLLVQRGVNGVEQVTYRQVFENDVEVSNTVFKTEVLVEPLPEIIMIGVQKPFTPVPVPGKLAYLAGGSAWLMETTTGNRRPVVTTGDLDGRIFSLSPRGDWLLFTRAEQNAEDEAGVETGKINSLWAIDLTEEGARPVNLKVDNVIHFAAWVPGKGLTITYSTVEPRSTAPGWQANNDLQMLTFAPTGTIASQETILETNAGGVYGWWGTSFSWSPDGALLAYARPDEIGFVDLEAKSLKPLASIVSFQTGSSWAWVPSLSWSPDRRVLYLVTHAHKAGLENQEASPLFDLAGLPLRENPLADENGPLISIIPQAGMFAYPAPAPQLSEQGGCQVAFLQAIFPEQSDTRRYRLAVMDRDGSNRRVIFPAEDRLGLDPQRVVWSPAVLDNGRLWLAVNYQGNLWLVDSETGDSLQVTGDGLITHFDWK